MRREQYFEQLEDLLPGGIRLVLVQLIKNSLHNTPSRRPTAEQLVTLLEGMKGGVKGPYGELATIDAVRHVSTMKTLKNEEIEQLRGELEVSMEYFHERIDL